MSTAAKGRTTEAAVLNAFIRRRHGVLVPFGGCQPYDLVIDLGGLFLRVQCKTGRPCRGGLMFNSKSTDHGHGPLSYLGLADAFGVYFPSNERVYVVPVRELDGLSCGKAILRLNPALNNQRTGIRLAADYEIDRWTDGALREVVADSRRDCATTAA